MRQIHLVLNKRLYARAHFYLKESGHDLRACAHRNADLIGASIEHETVT